MECLGPLRTAGSEPRLDSLGGCLPNTLPVSSYFSSVRNRRPITAIATKSFWNGVSDIKDVFAAAASNSNPTTTAQFYIKAVDLNSANDGDGTFDDAIEDDSSQEDRFFEDIESLYRRQTMLFQRSCDQLREIYELNSTPPAPSPSNASGASTISRPTAASTGGATNPKTPTPTTLPSPSPFGEIETSNVEALYVDCLYTVLNMIGCDADRDCQFQFVEHLRKAFKFDSKKHLELYEMAEEKPRPKLKLHLTIAEARDLATKGVSGLNDPFCTFAVKSQSGRQLYSNNTACKMRTLDPVWSESFEIGLGEEIGDGYVLHIDVWNFLPADEKLKEKLKRINEVRDPRGFRQYVVDAVNAASSSSPASSKGGQQQQQQPVGHKLIGSVIIPLQKLPACGLNKWWQLEKQRPAEKASCYNKLREGS